MYNNSTQLELELERDLPSFLNQPTIPSETTLLPLYYTSFGCENPTSPNTTTNIINNNKADSDLTYINNINIYREVGIVASRKRHREDLEALAASHNTSFCSRQTSSFPHHDVVSRFHQQHQLEIHRFISQYNQKLRMEVEERRRRETKVLVMRVLEEGGVMNKLKEKEEELRRMGEINWGLQEKVKSLYSENQAWRDMAQTNEATANTLRSNLEHLLAHVSGGGGESRCGSSGPHQAEECNSNSNKEEEEEEEGRSDGGVCNKCGERETSVLVLPCRHLCLCALCGSASVSVGTCPACHSPITATLHVNFS